MSDEDETRRVPVAEEQVTVGRRRVETGVVKVTKRVRTEPVHLEEVLEHEEIEVERVPVERWVDQPPEPYADGDTWVVPIVEEVLVVEKRLRVREEVRLTRRIRTRTERIDTERRVEEVEIRRTKR